MALAVLLLTLGAAAADLPSRSAVYVAQDDASIDEYRENAPVIRKMVDNLVSAVTGQPEAGRAWASLLKPTERVGIKISTAGGRYFSSHRAIVDAIVEGMVMGGHPRQTIFVWDREETGLRAAGYRKRDVGYLVRCIEPFRGYERSAVFSAPLLGRLIWGDLLFAGGGSAADLEPKPDQFSSQSHLCKILIHDVDRIVDVPVFSDAGCGVAGCLYNMTVPNVDNWRRLVQPPAFGDPAIGELYGDPRIGPKVVIHILDALVAQYAGGPSFDPNYAFDEGAIYASKDPVALDAIAVRKIDSWRRRAKLPLVEGRATYLDSAQAQGLGNLAPDRIDLKQAR